MPSSAPTAYVVAATPAAGGSATTVNAAGDAMSTTVTGLSNTIDYDVTVTATNEFGSAATSTEGPTTPDPEGSTPVLTPSAATVTPVHVSTPTDTAYTTEVVASDAIGAPTDVAVINSSPSDQAALTGVVTGSDGAAIAGATVAIAPSDQTTGTTTATTNAAGLFAFNDIPATTAGSAYDITITATGYGTYTKQNDTYFAGQTYQMDAALTSSTITFNAAIQYLQPQTSAELATASSAGGSYPSSTMMPPVVKVGFWHADHNNCSNQNEAYTGVKISYPWRLYIRKTAAFELGHDITNTAAVKANLVAESTYAWHHMAIGWRASEGYDARNTVDDQCFQPDVTVPTKINKLIDDQLKWRVVTANGSLDWSYFASGPRGVCPGDPKYGQKKNGDHLSQWGSQYMATQSSICPADARLTDWKDIDEYFYVGNVKSAAVPSQPNTSFEPVGGGVKLNFPSRKSGVDVGWKYDVQAQLRDPITHALTWQSIDSEAFRKSDRTIHTSYTYNAGSCTSYRAHAWNAVGWSTWGYFNDRSAICPG